MVDKEYSIGDTCKLLVLKKVDLLNHKTKQACLATNHATEAQDMPQSNKVMVA